MAGTSTGKKTYASRKGSKGGRRPPNWGTPHRLGSRPGYKRKHPSRTPSRRLKGERNVRGVALMRMRKAKMRRHPLGD